MRITSQFLFAACAGLAALGQTSPGVSRTFRFAHAGSVQNMNEIATAIRVIVDAGQVFVDETDRTLAMRGTADQMRLAEWLFNGLDLASPVAANSATHEFRMPGESGEVVRLYYLNRGQSTQDFQELATLVRTIGDIRRVYTYNEGKVVLLRGTTEQAAMADWLFSDVEKSAGQPRPHSISAEYRLPTVPAPEPNDNVLRVFYVANASTIQSFQELATAIRTITQIRRVYTFNAPRAVALRGTADQIALAAWLFDQTDRPAGIAPAPPSSVYHYQPADGGGDSVRVYYLASPSITDLQKIATQVRTQAGIQHIYTYTAPRILAARGTVDQIAQADRLLTQKEPAQ